MPIEAEEAEGTEVLRGAFLVYCRRLLFMALCGLSINSPVGGMLGLYFSAIACLEGRTFLLTLCFCDGVRVRLYTTCNYDNIIMALLFELES